MEAVVEAARGGLFKNFGEVVGDEGGVVFEEAEFANAGSVNDETALREGMHLGEGGGVGSFEMGIGDGSGFEAEAGDEGVDEGGFADTAVAGKKGCFALQEIQKIFERWQDVSRNGVACIPDGSIEAGELKDVLIDPVVIKVGFVKDDSCGDGIGFGRGQEAVNESGGSARHNRGGDNEGEVEVGSEDVGLLGKVDGFADDVIFAGQDFLDPSGGDAGGGFEQDPVAHHHGVGGVNRFEFEAAFDFAGKDFFTGKHVIVAACGFDNDALHGKGKMYEQDAKVN